MSSMEQQQQPIYHFTIYNIFVRTTQISQYQKKDLPILYF